MAQSNFVDYAKITCRSGRGGNGSTHLARSKYILKGGPDGGDGGRGGHVILRGNEQMWTLIHLKFNRHFFAINGESGSKNNSTGAQGKDIIIDVPPGTVIKDAETGKLIFEIINHGEEKILLEGGRGGFGNTHFKSSTNQTPRYAQEGGEEKEGLFILELKLLADVGLVGFPNAGKSTFLSVVSAAKPKIANYPFTTLEPNLGIVQVSDYESFVIADIPGIIEKASEGKGLGIRFLKHIEHNAILLFMVSAEEINIQEQYNILLKELEKYNPELLMKKRILAITKSDLADEEIIKEMKHYIPKDLPTIFISSFQKSGIPKLIDLLWEQLNVYA